MENIVIIGLGGIGTALVDNLFRFLQYDKDGDVVVTLVDGDKYEDGNIGRQSFSNVGMNKALTKKHDLEQRYPSIRCVAADLYITTDNIGNIINENDIIFMCVDNHPTRKLVSDYVQTLQDAILISGGNELIDGNVAIFVRKGGEKLTPALTDYHPEIRNPTGKHPEEMSCEELSVSDPQLLFTNLTVAVLMCWYYYQIQLPEKVKRGMKSETYFDLGDLALNSVIREPKD